MSGPPTLAEAVRSVVDRSGSLSAATEITARLDEPLRVAIAGRVKAGKSTLLNALVGERLAPTDAGECTKIVTWYRHGRQYDVVATSDDGGRRSVPFERRHDRLVLDLTSFDLDRVERLDVTWPSATLRRFTLIDTPGLEAHDEARAARTQRLLGLGDTDRNEVDAVIYLMRHVHRRDVEFLEAFADRSLPHPSPVDAVAVLSRADEIGAGRLDALDSAAAVAARYAAEARIMALCATVVPVAGLVGEAGRTLTEGEGGSLRAIAEDGGDELASLLLSVERFVDPGRSRLDPELRMELLLRLGLFGVRFAIDRCRSQALTTNELARDLVVASGVERLTAVLEDHFGRRAQLLKARTALANLKAAVATLPDSPETAELVSEVERLEFASQELAQLRLLHLTISGAAGFGAAETEEVEHLVSDGPPWHRLGSEGVGDVAALQAIALARLDDWRRRAAHPLATTARREACELVVSAYEQLHARLATA